MGQIIKRKKKGRPPKSDLAGKPRDSDPEPESRVRRSLRRRNVRYNFVDYDDFIEDDYFEEEEEDDDERRKEKKVKLVVKLNQRARAGHARESGASESEEEEEEDEDDESERRKLVKKRRISGCDEDEDEEQGGADDGEARGLAKGNLKELDSPPGTPSGTLSVIPLPDKKKLEFILDKLQKKDTYGVYAEPVDPEELPDYHDVIEHPMDFSTVRKKLANGSYSTLDQFESDVFLICSNAMRYNAPDTIYHKQAQTIQELGQKKFHKLRIDYERSEQELKVEQKSKIDFECPEKEIKSEQRTKSNFLVKKQTKKPLPRSLQEPVGSDFSAGATLAGDLPNVSTANQGGSHARAINYDGILESSTVFAENNVDKSEDLSIGKGLQSKLWRKPFTVDENRRATYNISNQPAVKVDSIFTTFEGEIGQLVAVGLHAENSYARSLARFAATLGPIAWKVASQRIEQAIPSGCKFGRGWVGEYEPPPTPVLLVENRLSKESSAVTNLQRTTDSRKDETPIKRAVPTRENVVNNSGIEVKPSLSCADTVSSPGASAGLRSNSAVNASHQRQNPVSRNSTGSGNRVVKQFELNSLPSANQCNADYIAEKKLVDKSETAASRSGEIVTKNLNHPQKEVSEAAAVSRSKETLPSSPQPASFRQADTNGVVLRGLGNGKIASSSSDNIRMSNTSSGLHSEMPRPPAFFLRQDQGLSDPVQLMRMLAEKAQQQQNSSQNVGNNAPSMTSVPSIRRDGGANAATTAASVWMSIGAGGFKQAAENSSSPRSQNTAESSFNSPRELHSPVPRARGEFPASSAAQFQHERNSVPPFMQAPIGLTNEAQHSNRPMVFSQLMNANLSRFQPQMPWRGIAPHAQPRAKPETLPPDLNIGFQSPGSPGRPSSGVKLDSQQPDLALQL